MAPFLYPCESCARHIRAEEAACPFCGAAAKPVGDAGARPSFARPLSRAALLFVSATATVGCSSSTSPNEPAADAAADTGGPAATDSGAFDGEPAALYGPAMIEDSGPGSFEGGPVAAYGPAQIPDSGTDSG